ncbi:MAG TPA: glycine cleavage system aminomethyltransferase GcvT [Marmoricola sp.]|nr:glycine cleavage system aminomethyltransferase GcvT [Marmoricola sp.]
MALHTALYDVHAALGAKFSEFGGWDMPLEYDGVLKEHAAVRGSVGVFDVSHLGKLTVTGPGAADFINRTFTNDLDRIHVGKAQYTLACDEATGGVVDDIIVYLRSDDDVLVVPNAANCSEIERRLRAAAPADLTITNNHADFVVLAVQGPKSDEVLQALGFPTGHEYMSFATHPFEGSEVVVCRTGYTGERGYELIAPSAVAVALWNGLLEAGAAHDIKPCGLGARDTLRTEMGYPLHGQDLSPSITPLMGAVSWAVGWDKAEFWGRDVLLAQRAEGAPRLLRGLAAQGRGIPRSHMEVVDDGGAVIGEVTSGTFSPTLRQGIALALLDRDIKVGDTVAVDIRGRREVFDVVKPPFVTTDIRG